MAELIPSLTTCLSKMTSGEKRLARRLETLLEDDYICWFDIPLGKKRRFPDFIILHPTRGLLFLEVKDWKLQNVKTINHQVVQYITSNGLVKLYNPLEQARQMAYVVIDRLKRDPALISTEEKFKGNLSFPYGYGAVFPNITRNQINKGIPLEAQERILPPHLVICQDEMTENTDPETFQEKLWGMFNYQFGEKLSLPQIDRIRWHLFPEIRIDAAQNDLFGQYTTNESGNNENNQDTIPDLIKIMDLKQERLARSLGDGHRVIHGVAGSGKTLILGYRCLYLTELTKKPILVLCYNISLASRLRCYIQAKGITEQVQIYHFHDWCGQQLKTYHVDVIEAEGEYWERQVLSVIQAVDKNQIPRGQYGAILIDEGHDFEPEWFKLVTQMIDPEINSLLLLYDDAQSIYKKNPGLGFTLSSVGIQAQGRTTILKVNYRNTREILSFAYNFAKEFLNPHESDEDHIPIIEPEVGGNSGPEPVFKRFKQIDDEIDFTVRCLSSWHQNKTSWKDICILTCPGSKIATQLIKKLDLAGIPYHWLVKSKDRKNYEFDENKITIMSIHSSKGLEFHTVIITGLGQMQLEGYELEDNARLLYVGMTRARERLLICASGENEIIKSLENSNLNPT